MISLTSKDFPVSEPFSCLPLSVLLLLDSGIASIGSDDGVDEQSAICSSLMVWMNNQQFFHPWVVISVELMSKKQSAHL